MPRCAKVFTAVYGHYTCKCVCGWVGLGVSFACVCANVCVCHSRDSKKIFLVSKDKKS